MERHEPWYRDAWLWGALLAALLLRALPLWLWSDGGCMRDECAYADLARAIVRGRGLQEIDGWLWAPGYPYLLAVFAFFGDLYRVKRFQVILSVATAALTYGIADQVGSRRAARHAAWLVALHPTLAFMAGTLWTETVYGFVVAIAVAGILWARRGGPWRGAAVGAAVAAAALMRGVGTWTLPVYLAALLWPVREGWGEALRRRWRHGAIAAATAVLLVSPYSWHASRRHGGLVITDATVGQVAYIGNNDFPLFTYDWGNGLLGEDTVAAHLARGRPRCDKMLPAAVWNRCEVERAIGWIRDHPGEFVRRVPVRWAQLLNPNSFLTRHVRMGRWWGLPWWIKEGLVLWVLAASTAVTFGGTLGAWAWARGPVGAVSVGLVLYQLAVVGALFGMTRFRVPLVPLWIVWFALVTADPRGTLHALSENRWRAVGATVTAVVLVPLVGWFFLSGIPALWR